MKIHECSNQLNKLMTMYNTVYDFSGKIADSLCSIDKDNLTFFDVYQMHLNLYHLYTDSSNYIKNMILENYVEINLIDENEIKMSLKLILDDLNSNINLMICLTEMINSLDDIIKEKNLLIKDHLKLQFIMKYYNHGRVTCNDDLLKTFNTVIECRNKLINYVNNLEVPEKPDYEVE